MSPLVGQVISFVLGSVLQNSGDKNSNSGMINSIVSNLDNKIKKSNSKPAPKPLLKQFDDTNTM